MIHDGIDVRAASAADEAAIVDIDTATWNSLSSPAPRPKDGSPFFTERRRPEDALVAEVGGLVVGYVVLRQVIPVPSHRHVLELAGLAVAPDSQRHGVGRRLVQEAAAEAARRGAAKLSLRVLGRNPSARRLYESCGFVVEGVLRDEFILDGRPVDDVLMARRLT